MLHGRAAHDRFHVPGLMEQQDTDILAHFDDLSEIKDQVWDPESSATV